MEVYGFLHYSECVVAWNGVNYDAIILATGNEKIVTVLKPEIF